MTPCRGCGGTGHHWDRAKNDWGDGKCGDCCGSGISYQQGGQAMRTYSPGQRIIFRENETGRPEAGVILQVLPPTDSHPNGGEYDLMLYDESTVVAWVGELESA